MWAEGAMAEFMLSRNYLLALVTDTEAISNLKDLRAVEISSPLSVKRLSPQHGTFANYRRLHQEYSAQTLLNLWSSHSDSIHSF